MQNVKLPKEGQNVELYLKNNIVISGTVLSVSNQQIILKEDGTDNLLLTHPFNVVLAKIFSDVPQDVRQKLAEQIKYEPENLDLRAKNMVELKLMEVEEEKKKIAESLHSHSFEATGQQKFYEPPFNLPQYDTAQKTPASKTSNLERMRSMQRKK